MRVKSDLLVYQTGDSDVFSASKRCRYKGPKLTGCRKVLNLLQVTLKADRVRELLANGFGSSLLILHEGIQTPDRGLMILYNCMSSGPWFQESSSSSYIADNFSQSVYRVQLLPQNY